MTGGKRVEVEGARKRAGATFYDPTCVSCFHGNDLHQFE